MIIDCMSCVARPTECGDCVVSVVLGPHPAGVELDADERLAVAVLAGSGLVPPLRLMPGASPDEATADAAGVDSVEAIGAADAAAGPRAEAPPRWSRRQRAG